MKLLRSVLALCALALAVPAFAQSTYPTPSGPRVNGVVPLTCNTTGANCVPVAGDANGTVVQPAPSSTFWAYAPPVGGITNSATAVVVKAAAGAGVRNYVTSMQCWADALGAATELVVLDNVTVIWRGKLQTNGLVDGTEITFSPPLRGTANTTVSVQTVTASVTGSVYCSFQGYTGS